MLVSQRKFAKIVGFSHTYINKLVKKGVLPTYNKKIKVDEAEQILKEMQDPTREAQREANARRRGDVDIFTVAGKYESIADLSPDERKRLDEERKRLEQEKEKLQKQSTDEKLNEVAETIYEPELDELLKGAKSPLQRTQIMKNYYDIKIARIKAYVEEGKYYPKEEIDKKAEKIIMAAKNRALVLPTKVAPHLLGINDVNEAKEILDRAIHEFLSELARLSDELV